MSSPDSEPLPADDVAARCRFEVHTDDDAFLAKLAEDVRRGFARRPWSLDIVLDDEAGDLRDAGLTLAGWYTDDARRFGLVLARPV